MKSNASVKVSKIWATWFVALRDIIHEPLLTSCLILSITSVLVPLMLLFSVKVGFIEELRSDFITDPTFREIRPLTAEIKSREQLDILEKLRGVQYLVPSVMMSPREVTLQFRRDGRQRRVRAKLVPSSVGDPIHERISGQFDAANVNSVVLTSDIALENDLSIEDNITIVISRVENHKTVRVMVEVIIAGVLPHEILPQPSILASSALDQAVENFRAGIGVPERGWSSTQSVPKQAFQSILIATPRELEEAEQRQISLRIGGVRFDKIIAPEIDQKILYDRLAIPSQMKDHPLLKIRKGITHIYEISNSLDKTGNSRPYSARDVKDAQEHLDSISAIAIGSNPPILMKIAGEDITGLSLDPRLFTGMRRLYYKWRFGTRAKLTANQEIYLFSNQMISDADNVNADFQLASKDRVLNLPVRLRKADLPEKYSLISPTLAAMIRRGWDVPLAFHSHDQTLVELSTGFRGFRLVARQFEDVPDLVRYFDSKSIKVRAKIDEILRLQRLDRSLTLMVLVVGCVALIGGISVVASNFIASVKRKAIDFATYRLIGVSRGHIFLIPLIQSVVVASISYIIGVLLYFIISASINNYIAELVNFHGQLSRLETIHFLWIAVFVVVGSLCASLFSAREATSIDPSLALRRIG